MGFVVNLKFQIRNNVSTMNYLTFIFSYNIMLTLKNILFSDRQNPTEFSKNKENNFSPCGLRKRFLCIWRKSRTTCPHVVWENDFCVYVENQGEPLVPMWSEKTIFVYMEKIKENHLSPCGSEKMILVYMEKNRSENWQLHLLVLFTQTIIYLFSNLGEGNKLSCGVNLSRK